MAATLRRRGYWGKRLLDILGSLLLLVACAPLIVGTALLVRLKLGSPVLFRQQRPGLLGRPFTIYKFRTMANRRNAAGELLPDAERLNRFGLWLRSTSLDELPELFNVLSGDMSLVGPRPLLMEYLPRYTPDQMRRHEVRPGITGWAQVNGRNNITWENRFALDVWYVDHVSFSLDFRILLLTPWVTLRRKDISQAGRVTRDRFMGSEGRS